MSRTEKRPRVPVALCADDYAISPGVDDGILALADAGRITAFSCMTASPRWPEAAVRIRPLFDTIDIGLHFVLTQLAPLGSMPSLAPEGRFPQLGALYSRAVFRRIELDEIEAELTRQIDAFAEAAGRLPVFLDGHHHVHQLPGIQRVAARIWKARVPSGWIRNTATAPTRVLSRSIAMPRAALLAAFGQAAKRTLRSAGIQTNADFAGVRNFDEQEPYRALMRRYLERAVPGLLIMCHPGKPESNDTLASIDYVTGVRVDEYNYLSGAEFLADLDSADCELVRLSSLGAR